MPAYHTPTRRRSWHPPTAAPAPTPARNLLLSLPHLTLSHTTTHIQWLLAQRRGSDAECALCFNVFGASGAAGTSCDPAILPGCGHTVCLTCARQLHEERRDCPICGVAVATAPSLNWALKAMLESLTAKECEEIRLAAAMAASNGEEDDTALRSVISKEELAFDDAAGGSNVLGSGACGVVRRGLYRGRRPRGRRLARSTTSPVRVTRRMPWMITLCSGRQAVAVKTLRLTAVDGATSAAAMQCIEASFFQEAKALSEFRWVARRRVSLK